MSEVDDVAKHAADRCAEDVRCAMLMFDSLASHQTIAARVMFRILGMWAGVRAVATFGAEAQTITVDQRRRIYLDIFQEVVDAFAHEVTG